MEISFSLRINGEFDDKTKEFTIKKIIPLTQTVIDENGNPKKKEHTIIKTEATYYILMLRRESGIEPGTVGITINYKGKTYDKYPNGKTIDTHKTAWGRIDGLSFLYKNDDKLNPDPLKEGDTIEYSYDSEKKILSIEKKKEEESI